MRVHYMLFAVASAFLLANNIVASANTVANPSKVATTDDAFTSEHGKSADKRSLRIRETEEDDDNTSTDNEDDEERLNPRMWLWLKKGYTPDRAHKWLGLDGLGESAHTHKNYPKYLEYSKKWWANQ
ncbi:hypothetical protein PR003_g19441 [Phytophthora rubi]|uniref:RxLR effector protein n=1 Tax=Phytophthora rubi TaxID=129364 RepID=A0A6A4DZD3_9STRA|nr:hypothetical protein PR002_g18843 [Phytophthora rubi]KAE9001841.1 hypothetical protein PR001_g18413 [Phytophthora rubi]KAE9313651.1 hypothetical protein PR003_g19441 [Phytophthora rubi]